MNILKIIIFGVLITYLRIIVLLPLLITHYAVILHKFPMVRHSLTPLSNHPKFLAPKLFQVVTTATLLLEVSRYHLLQLLELCLLMLLCFVSEKVWNTLLPHKLFVNVRSYSAGSQSGLYVNHRALLAEVVSGLIYGILLRFIQLLLPTVKIKLLYSRSYNLNEFTWPNRFIHFVF